MPLNFYLDWRGEQKRLLKQQRDLTLAALQRMNQIYELLSQRNFQLVLAKLEEIMAANSEILGYSKRVVDALDNIAADIQRILSNPSTVLSDEDRATLEGVATKAETLAAQNPEPQEPPVEPV